MNNSQSKTQDVKAIVFDLDGVYFPKGKNEFLHAIVKLGVSEAEAKRVFLKSDQMNKEYKNGQLTDDEFWCWAAKEWKLEKTPEELVRLLIAGYEVDEHVRAFVRAIRKKGYKTLVCSNNFPARIQGLHERFRFLNDFDAVALSYEVGVSKPDKKIFETLIQKAGVPAETIVFADDNPDNLAGAREVGIITFVYEGFEKFVKRLRKFGVRV